MENIKEKKVYSYTHGITENKNRIKVKGDEVYYTSVLTSEQASKVVGITNFKKPKKEQDTVLLHNSIYGVRDIKDNDEISGYIETEDGNFIAFNTNNKFLFLWWFFLFFWLIIIVIFIALFRNGNNEDTPNPDKDKPVWNIGGIDGTDTQLTPETETQYNTYWGYQEITIDKTMKVPVVNKETNTSYAQFTLYDKQGNQIWQSVLIKPGARDEWDAYAYYNGKSGTYLHDLKLVFYNPVYEGDEIVDFIPSMFAANTPDFTVHIK